ncbi:DUF1294 domain-containing protein [Sphingopyxis sp. GC21]|uniref:DUF1294 domain-containing protein n=1 Tax=Sphingopyxis sp. GC21 TaxID=2933562 RepID=UPI0021E3DE52|nr:DUF1294 domain-containing protein [Sphingopyxis sp. GC21]
MTAYILYWLVAANLNAFALMVIDKQRADKGLWRIREATLLDWARIGGAIGAVAASRLVRHKTRKQPFADDMHFLFAMELVLLALWALGLFDPLLSEAASKVGPSLSTALAYLRAAT